ncbi:MotA/TolQ/ExbB proton channel family protein [Paraliomyxa miuraensis]|uniref:MotA/TolQ/ExbB proton channel family protein n=1 Tax=Paraliomyxa miuraensis TaxID=376150 RepID=UPI00224E72E2|nr:MotA/TolQ/ExbB proton channel family protein [Paraliomyxa miuraensis]MCX4242478.1 MotA/TolQ/ExbB proton channel family protein [Paraliomyxa miuraensis]
MSSSILSPVITLGLLAFGDQHEMSMRELLEQGGLAMYPIYGCSMLALAIFVHKLIELRQAGLHRVGWLDGVLAHVRADDYGAAQDACRGPRHPGARVVQAVCRALDKRPEQAESEAKRVGSLELQRLERRLGMLSLLAQIAPLLGLLGTVLGMVDLFMGLQGIEQANLAISDLASGIWKALLTTAAGLTVAVPTLAAHVYLSTRVDDLRLQLGDMVARVLFEAGLEAPTERVSERSAQRAGRPR